MKVCVIGCVHGELEDLYQAILETEAKTCEKVDLVLCCGDFQAVRNLHDLSTMACPQKYRAMNSFYKYYSGALVAPILTVFVGGNHEASNHLQELPYGGWVAPNMYYLGLAGCVRINDDLVLCGLSGIYDGRDVNKGHFERMPFDKSTERSVYHTRQFDANRLFMLPKQKQVAVFLSHDWPRSVVPKGNPKTEELLRKKPFFREDIYKGELGSPILADLLSTLRPSFWFSAHLHVKFATTVWEEEDLLSSEESRETRFLALDKVVKGRDFLQILSIPCRESPTGRVELFYDPDWLAIVKATHDMTPLSHNFSNFGLPNLSVALDFVRDKVVDFRIPENFFQTVPVHMEGGNKEDDSMSQSVQGNPQLDRFYEMMELKHLLTIPWNTTT